METEIQTIVNQIYQLLQSSDSQLNKQASVLLNTLVAQIKGKQPAISEEQLPTALFAMLVSLISSSQEDYTPILLLLNMIINRVSVAIFKRMSLPIQSQIVQIMKKDSKYLKYCVVILTQTIQIMSREEFLQNDASNMEIIRSIIDTLWTDNTLARREAQKSIKMILEQKFFYKTQICLALKEFVIENLESQEVKRVVFVAQFLNTIVQLLPVEVLGDITYALVQALETEDEELLTHIYLCLEQIMESRPLTIDITETLLKQFLSNQPSFYKDSKVVQAYGQCMVQTLLHMNTVEPKTAKKYITSCIAVLQEILLVENEKQKVLPGFAQKSLELLIENTVDSSLWKISNNAEDDLLEDFLKIDIDFQTGQNQKAQHFQKIIIMLKHMLTSRFHQKLKYVFEVIGTFFEQIDSSVECFQHVEPFFFEFLTFRNEDKLQGYFKKCFGRLVSNIGSEYLLQKFPMSLNGNVMAEDFEDKNNLWLLPYFQKNAKKQKLMTYVRFFVPLISKITNAVDITVSGLEKLNNEHKIFKSVHYLLWECFPNFVSVSGKREEDALVLSEFLKSLPSQLKENYHHFDTLLRGLSHLIVSLPQSNVLQAVVRDQAQNLISHLAKLIAPQKHRSKIILNVIGYLGQVAPKDYLDKAFKKNITKLISDKLDGKLAGSMSASLKNFDIINQILPSVEIKDDKWDISTKFVKCFIEEQNALQKKTYRFLRVLIYKVHSSYLPQIIDNFHTSETVLNFSRPIRIQLIRDFWDKLEMATKDYDTIADLAEFIQQFLPELIVGLRDSNKKCRRISGELFALIGKKMDDLEMLQDFVSMVSAGLAGETSLMKANSITAVSFLMENFGAKLDRSFIKDLQSVILMLIRDENKEEFKAILYFLKKFQKNMTKDVLEHEMPQIFEKIFSTSDQIRGKFLTQIKQIVFRLIRKFGIQMVEKSMPEAHKNLPKGIMKAEKRAKKLKEQQKNQFRRETKKDEKQKKMLRKMGLDEDHDDDNENNMEQEEEEQGLANRGRKEEQNLLLKFDSEKSNFHFVEKQCKEMRKKNNANDEDEDIEDVEFKNGKLIVTDLEELQKRQQKEQNETGQKRKRVDRFADLEKILLQDKEKQDGEEGEEPAQRKIVKVASKKHQKLTQKKKFVHNILESGESYRAQGQSLTGGDVQIKNKPDPYAYVQLNPKALNKRHRNKAVKTFEEIFNSGANGLKGIKTSSNTKKVKQD